MGPWSLTSQSMGCFSYTAQACLSQCNIGENARIRYNGRNLRMAVRVMPVLDGSRLQTPNPRDAGEMRRRNLAASRCENNTRLLYDHDTIVVQTQVQKCWKNIKQRPHGSGFTPLLSPLCLPSRSLGLLRSQRILSLTVPQYRSSRTLQFTDSDPFLDFAIYQAS